MTKQPQDLVKEAIQSEFSHAHAQAEQRHADLKMEWMNELAAEFKAAREAAEDHRAWIRYRMEAREHDAAKRAAEQRKQVRRWGIGLAAGIGLTAIWLSWLAIELQHLLL